MLLAILKFVLWELATTMAALRLARIVGWRGVELWLGALAFQVTLESSVAALFSFTRLNSPAAYWIAAVLLSSTGIRACVVWWREGPESCNNHTGMNACATVAALATPLLWLSFRPVEEIDSINYLHYLIDWMGNRATPYTFATNYVAFWELSFLPTWTVTRFDWFFPLLALKAVALLAMALWLVGIELRLKTSVLLWTVFGALAMRHYWYEYSGVPTLKNDVLHGVGFVLLLLVVLRSSNRTFGRSEVMLLALGASFAAVKYTGIFLAALACGFLFVRGLRSWILPAALFLITSGHYYLRSLIQHGNPFYPFQINLAFIHLPGTADLSYTSILYHWRDPRLWRAFFWPAGGISPAGLLFPLILLGSLTVAIWFCIRVAIRRQATPLDWTAAALLCGWLLYFRSVFSASAGPSDLSFVLNNLNSIRYVDGVLAVSEVFLAAILGRFALPLVALNLSSRLLAFYLQCPWQVFVIAGIIFAMALIGRFIRAAASPAPRGGLLAAAVALCLVIACPLLVESHRAEWTAYWNDLKPELTRIRGSGLAVMALEDAGYYAGHVVAAGNPVNPSVRTLLPSEIENIGENQHYLALLVTPGSAAASNWQARYGPMLTKWGYQPHIQSKFGAIYEHNFR